MECTYNIQELRKFFEINDMEEVIDALDNIIYAATMHYLDTDNRGIPLKSDAYDISITRFLLETLRNAKKG
jgi:hypothetical protein|nr:MAG TPA: hypothetical protein [Caudoviricetes sp.]